MTKPTQKRKNKDEIQLTKVKTQYAVERTDFILSVNEEFPHISVHEYGDPCSGVLRHWGTPEELIAECELIIKIIKTHEQSINL